MVEGTCPACLYIFSDPQILCCNHNVCLSCSLKLIVSQQITTDTEEESSADENTAGGENVYCPVCQCATPVSDLKPNVALKAMVEVLKSNSSFLVQCSGQLFNLIL